MTRETSIQAYNVIRESGLLSERRFEVYEIIVHHGPMTGNELIDHLRKTKPVGNTGAYNTRLSELREQGVVEEIGQVKCPITGNQTIQWGVVDRLPVPLVKKPSKNDLLKKGLLKIAKDLAVLRHSTSCRDTRHGIEEIMCDVAGLYHL